MDKKLLLILFMTTATMMVFNYYTYKEHQKGELPASVAPGQSYKVPSQEDLMRPLNREIDFLDKEVSVSEDFVNVQTDLYDISFSNYGGTISDLSFRKRLGKNKTPLKTIERKEDFNREEASFLVALDKKTPYLYKFLGKEDLDDRINVSYEAQSDGNIIKKTYSIHKNKYQIDLILDLSSKTGIRPRVLLPAPSVPEVPQDVISGFVFNKQKKSIEPVAEVINDNAWLIPVMFGTQNKYFAHALIQDESSLTQRAYYKSGSSGEFISILEGGEVIGKSAHKISFYMGPKDVQDMNAVDNKLEGLLNFGWLTWLCKLMLKLLEFLYKYLGNFGLAIIALTIIIKVPLMPLSMKSAAVMEKNSKYEPQVARIRQKYKHDLQAQQVEITNFYKSHNMSPLSPVLGCLPSLIDLPIMYSLYNVLGSYMDLYQAPFMLWIQDLSAKDPYYILPIVMGISMLWQQSLTPIKDDRQRVMFMLLPIVFTGLFANFSAGLVLYWLVRNLLTVGETYLRRAFK